MSEEVTRLKQEAYDLLDELQKHPETMTAQDFMSIRSTLIAFCERHIEVLKASARQHRRIRSLELRADDLNNKLDRILAKGHDEKRVYQRRVQPDRDGA